MDRDNKGRFCDGNDGKPKGTKNKLTREIQDALNYILTHIKTDDWDDIINHIKSNKPETFINLLAKIAPKNIQFDDDEPLTIRIIRETVDGNTNKD